LFTHELLHSENVPLQSATHVPFWQLWFTPLHTTPLQLFESDRRSTHIPLTAVSPGLQVQLDPVHHSELAHCLMQLPQ
jgi:hypothetical protein